MNDRDWIIEQVNTRPEYDHLRTSTSEIAYRWIAEVEQRVSSIDLELNRLSYGVPRIRMLRAERMHLMEALNQYNFIKQATTSPAISWDGERSWVPIYLFRKVFFPAHFSYTPESRLTWLNNQMYDLIEMPTYTTTLERCVELFKQVESILNRKQLRIRNVLTNEVIPCELF